MSRLNSLTFIDSDCVDDSGFTPSLEVFEALRLNTVLRLFLEACGWILSGD